MVLISEHLPLPCVDHLYKLGYTPISLPADPRLAPPIASHPDMLLFIGQEILITDRYYYEAIAKKQIDRICHSCSLVLQLTDEPPSHEYPHDIRFNAACVGQYLFCMPRYTSPAILSYAKQSGLHIVPVRQGYARCSLCPVGSRALITADPSIYHAARQKNDLDTLLVCQGHVKLPGYSTGFIGGSCGSHQNQLYFCGNLNTHPDSTAIRAFIQSHGIDSVSLSNAPLYDAGSLFFVSLQTKG